MKTETKIVSVTVRGVTRNVTVERTQYNEENGWGHWYIRSGERVAVRFSTGTKTHTTSPIIWERVGGKFGVNERQVVHNRSCYVVGWADQVTPNSLWTDGK